MCAQANPEFERAVDETGWYEHIRTILCAAYRVRDLLDVDAASALVHCSDGWDRTAQTARPPPLAHSLVSIAAHLCALPACPGGL